ncbi:alpha/beta fold hydrolase [Henriciella aquimarina]|uniref:alpha/beta fold hydrolase n=1 Tax=Henriciella aquimarina TaxID=545261 RepID=UPI000A00812A|nr:alpha/beta hydrolase [Henriciella aquimarina]
METWCTVNGLKLRAIVWHGDRPGLPIVFLNGVGTSLEIVVPFAERFSGRRFIALEMPGAGLTPATDMPLPPPILARIVIDAVAQLGARHFDLIGLSLGGALAQQITLQYRASVARLILAGTCSGVSMVPHDWTEESLVRSMNPFAAVIDDLMSDMSGPHLKPLIWPTLTSVANQFASFAGWSSLPFLPLLTAPTLILAGARDRIVPAANALQLSAFIPRAQHHILPDAGHMFPFTEPERTASHIQRFFENAPLSEAQAA